MSSDTSRKWDGVEEETFIGPDGEAAMALKTVIDRRWNAIVTEQE
jgi:hypothetical protein